MEKPIVLVWREVLASDVIKAHILETGAAPDLQDREVQVELTELTKDTRVMLAGCLMDGWSPNVGLVVVGVASTVDPERSNIGGGVTPGSTSGTEPGRSAPIALTGPTRGTDRTTLTPPAAASHSL